MGNSLDFQIHGICRILAKLRNINNTYLKMGPLSGIARMQNMFSSMPASAFHPRANKECMSTKKMKIQRKGRGAYSVKADITDIVRGVSFGLYPAVLKDFPEHYFVQTCNIHKKGWLCFPKASQCANIFLNRVNPLHHISFFWANHDPDVPHHSCVCEVSHDELR